MLTLFIILELIEIILFYLIRINKNIINHFRILDDYLCLCFLNFLFRMK